MCSTVFSRGRWRGGFVAVMYRLLRMKFLWVMLSAFVAVAVVVAALVIGGEAGRRAERLHLNMERNPTAGLPGSAPFHGRLRPGSYYGVFSGGRVAIIVGKNGSLEVTGDLSGENKNLGMHAFLFRFRRSDVFGVPSLSVTTRWTQMAGPRRNRLYQWGDIGVCGRPRFEAERRSRGAVSRKRWWLRGRWVEGAAVQPPFLVYKGLRYRYVQGSGRWRSQPGRSGWPGK